MIFARGAAAEQTRLRSKLGCWCRCRSCRRRGGRFPKGNRRRRSSRRTKKFYFNIFTWYVLRACAGTLAVLVESSNLKRGSTSMVKVYESASSYVGAAVEVQTRRSFGGRLSSSDRTTVKEETLRSSLRLYFGVDTTSSSSVVRTLKTHKTDV